MSGQAAPARRDFPARVEEAQRLINESIVRAGLQRDPHRHVLEATASVIGLFPELVQHLEATRQPVRDAEMRQAVIHGIGAYAHTIARGISFSAALALGALVFGAFVAGGLVDRWMLHADIPGMQCGDDSGGRVCWLWVLPPKQQIAPQPRDRQ